MSGGIYIIKNIISKKVYVGSAKNFKTRWKDHTKDLLTGTHINIHLQRSYQKHGPEAFEFNIVEQLGDYTRNEYFERENAWMDKLRAEGITLYNIGMAQGGWSFHDAESKQKIGAKVSARLKRTFALMSSEERKTRFAYWSTDKHYPEHARKAISEKLTGIIRSDETKAKMKIAQNQEYLKEPKREIMSKIGKTNKGKSPPNKGQKASTETRLKQSAAKLGKPMSEENKIKRKGWFNRMTPEAQNEYRQIMSASVSASVKRKPVVIEGIEFQSMSAAAKHFNKSMTWIYNRIKND